MMMLYYKLHNIKENLYTYSLKIKINIKKWFLSLSACKRYILKHLSDSNKTFLGRKKIRVSEILTDTDCFYFRKK